MSDANVATAQPCTAKLQGNHQTLSNRFAAVSGICDQLLTVHYTPDERAQMIRLLRDQVGELRGALDGAFQL